MSRTLSLAAETDTLALGSALASALGGVPQARFVLWLRGDLGAGKTTLVRGLLRAMGHEGRVKSPTYTLVEPYRVAGRTVLHCDLYRLANPGEMDYLGLSDLLDDNAVLLVEWPEHGAQALPGPDLDVYLAHRPRGRECRLEGLTPAGAVVLAALGADPGVEEQGGL